MPISNLPTFVPREILTAGKLNQLTSAISSKFSAITGADLTWPLVAQGNIDFDSQHSIVGLRTFWNIVNADEYDTLQLAIDAAEAAGGGCVLIPPDTTIVADGVSIEQSDITIMGCGTSSVIQLTTGSTSGFLFRTGTSTLTNISIQNLTLDGQATGTAQKGVIVRFVNYFTMREVWIKNFTGDAIQLTNDGTDGQGCVDVELVNIRCQGGSADHLIGDDVDGLSIVGFTSRTANSDSIALEPSGTAALMRDIQITNFKSIAPGGKGISILGASAAVSDNHSRILLTNCTVSSSTGDSYELGETSKILKWVNVRACSAISAGADAYVITSSGGTITGCHGPGASGDGLDLVDSVSYGVYSNDFSDAGANGVDADGTTDCVVRGNDVHGATTEGLRRDTATGLVSGGNFGEIGTLIGTTHFDRDGTSHTGDTNETTLLTYTIPRDTLYRKGDGLRITAYWTFAGGAGNTTVRVKISGSTTASETTNAGPAVTVVEMSLPSDDSATSNFGARSWVEGAGAPMSVIVSQFSADWKTDRTILFTGQLANGADTVTLQDVLIEFIGGEPS